MPGLPRGLLPGAVLCLGDQAIGVVQHIVRNSTDG
jgi:hypothetical protein